MSKRAFRSTWSLLVGVSQIVNGMRAERNYQALPEVPAALPTVQLSDEGWPGISVIVPARNEAANLSRLLSSLLKQDYPTYEVLVIDDASTDRTAALARSYAQHGVRLLSSSGPPPGWTGKNSACWLGAQASRSPWLLFVDADTELAPTALRSSLAFALERDLRAISLFARQRCETFWEKVLLPFAYQQYFVGVSAQQVHSVHGPALANGQYFLVRRDVYMAVGGHAANAESIIDDVALATSLKEHGVIPFACRGEHLVTVRMYTSLREIVRGFGKNAYLFLRQSPCTGVQTALSTSLAAPILPLGRSALHERSCLLWMLTIVAYAAQVWHARAWMRRFAVQERYALFAPLAALVFSGIALNSMLRVLTGRTLLWKGRAYRAASRKRVRYRLPRRWLMEMGRDLLFKRPRAIQADSALGVGALPVPPLITGCEHIPPTGSFVVVANHYQRFDVWIGWSGALLIDTIAQRRDVVLHLVTTDRARIGRFTVPATRWLIERVAAVWDLLLVTPPAIARQHQGQPHYALLRLMRRLKRSDERAVCILLMPEGDEGNTCGLIEAMPGSGRALYALSCKGLPLVPAAVWEEKGRLHASFGKPFSLAGILPSAAQALDMKARDRVMRHIAALLPPLMRGKYTPLPLS